MLTFATVEVLVIILTVLTWTVESNNDCEDNDIIWPCNCTFEKSNDGSSIDCKHDNWTAIKEALKKISSANFLSLTIVNDGLLHFQSALIKKIKTQKLDLQFPNLVTIDKIDGNVLQTRIGFNTEIIFSGCSFLNSPLNATKHIALNRLTISNNPNLERIERNEFEVLTHSSLLQNLEYSGTSLRYIGNGTFKWLTGLESLSLNNNKLAFISPEILPKTGKLLYIDLSFNAFTTFPREFVKRFLTLGEQTTNTFQFQYNKLSDEMNLEDWNVIMNSAKCLDIGLSGMKFDCTSCALTPITKIIIWPQQKSYITGAECSYPEEKKNRLIRYTSEEDLKHCFKYKLNHT
ncbi:Uncharacterised protein g4031 [Pycnogonum litorale]